MKKLTQIYHNGVLYDIGGSGTIDATTNIVGSADTHYINDRYRDHAGDMNFVNPMHRFFGWYVPNVQIVRSNKNVDVQDAKTIYSPQVIRLSGDNIRVEDIKKTDIKGDIRYPAYCTEYTTTSKAYKEGYTYKNDLTGETIIIKPKTYSSYSRHVVLLSGNCHAITGEESERFHVEMPKINTKKNTVILTTLVDWEAMPQGSYIRFEVVHHKIDYRSVRFGIVHTEKKDASIKDKFFGQLQMQTLTKDEEKGCYVGANAREYGENKIEYAGKRYTWMVLELVDNGGYIDSASGMIFDVFFNQRYYKEACIGLGQKEFLYITNPTQNVGALRNTEEALKQFDIPISFPKTGDLLKVINAPAPEYNKEIEMKTYLCLNAHGGDNTVVQYGNVINPGPLTPSNDIHMDTLRYAYPLPKNYDPVFEKWYFSEGCDHAYLSRFKRVKPV